MFRTIVLNFKRNKLQKKLNDRDLKDFHNIIEYIGMSSLSSIEREEIYQQILDMMLQAKNKGKFASEVIGNDMKGFCDSIIEESNYNKSIFHKCFNQIESFFQMGLISLLMIFVFDLILNGGDSSFKNQDVLNIYTVTFTALVLTTFPIGFIIKRKKIFKKKKSKTDYSWVLLTIFIFLYSKVTDMINTKFPQLANTHIIPHYNKIFLLIIFLIAFGRDICYFIKSISGKFREK